MKECKKCGETKTWSGDNILCPFSSSDSFGVNWNCGIINKIREICDKAMEGNDSRLHYQYCNDQKYVIINTESVDELSEEDDDLGLCLFVTWYKRRGATDAMWLLSDGGIPQKPTFEQLTKIANFYLPIKAQNVQESDTTEVE